VRCFYQDNDTIWIGTEIGLTIYHDGKFEDLSERFSLSDLVLFDITRDRQGDMWFACRGERYFGPSGGLVKWDGKKATIYSKNDGLADDNIGCFLEDDQGLWMGTDIGFSLFKDGRFENFAFDDASSECHSQVIALRNDSRGNKWIGAVGGLSLSRNGEIECFSNHPSLKAKMIFLLELQGDSILWVGSAEGLEKVDLNTFYDTGEIKAEYYNGNNGFYGTECNQNAVLKDSKGRFWFGTIKGAVCYDPSKDRSETRKVPVLVTDLRLNGNYTDWKSKGFNVSDVNGLPENLKLDYQENNLLIEFLGLNPLDPRGMSYSFRLEGLDDQWSEPSLERSVYYSNLTPGAYSFQVRSGSPIKGEFSYSSSYQFEIVPAFWQEGWFIALSVLLLFLSVLGTFYLRVRNIERREKEKQEFKNRLSELEMTALRSQMNPHFLFNSLNSVNHFILKNNREQASRYLTKFSRLVRVVLQNSKEKQVTLFDELEALQLYMELERLRFDEAFEYAVSIDPHIDPNDYLIPPLLLQPYVENAIWHGLLHLEERKGKLKIEVSQSKTGLKILIEDNGVGREMAEKMKSKSATRKKSLGMKINEDRMKLTEELYNSKTRMTITDLKSGETAPGTRVEVNVDYDV
jgi:hypothetical protein